jgi:hypothetical protein
VGLERDSKFEYQNQEADEDMLFARLIVLRLKKLPMREKRNVSLPRESFESQSYCFQISSQIFELLNAKEDEIN